MARIKAIVLCAARLGRQRRGRQAADFTFEARYAKRVLREVIRVRQFSSWQHLIVGQFKTKTAAALLFGAALLPLLASGARAQTVEFAARVAPADVRAGETAQIILTAKIPAGYHMYSLSQDPGGGVPLTINLVNGGMVAMGGKPVGSAFKKVPEPILKVTLEEYTGAATFGVPLSVKAGAKGSQKAALHVQYQICNERICRPPAQADVPVSVSVAPGTARANRKKPLTMLPTGKAALLTGPHQRKPLAYGLHEHDKTVVVQAERGTLILAGGPPDAPPVAAGGRTADVGGVQSGERSQSQGLLPFLLGAIAAGFTSLLTPCVFPMIPITVSFFTKRRSAEGETAKNQATQGVRGALAYCLGIIGTFTGLGLLTTVLFGATGIQNLAANPYVNIALGTLFVILAANLMGAFEILLPTWLLNRTQGAQGKNGGLIAPLLMGLTFTLTSFTCTSPFVGTVLLAAAHGHYFYPVVGMLGFSTAFALPFFLLALFPQTLARMPKSGGWLVTVKAFMGFLELAAALKFFSSADLTWGAGVLTRPIFLALWAGISVVAGLYLLGWLRLPHDDKPKIGIARRVFGILTVVGGVYCLAGIEGKSLGQLEAFVPPTPYPYIHKAGQTGSASPILASSAPGGAVASDVGTPKNPIMNFDEAVKVAQAQNKPIFIDFTGYNCVNCRLMEKSTLIDPAVVAELSHYVYTELFTDRGDAENQANQQIEQRLAKTTALPIYCAVTPDGKTVVAQSEGYTRDVNEYLAFLRKGRQAR